MESARCAKVPMCTKRGAGVFESGANTRQNYLSPPDPNGHSRETAEGDSPSRGATEEEEGQGQGQG